MKEKSFGAEKLGKAILTVIFSIISIIYYKKHGFLKINL